MPFCVQCGQTVASTDRFCARCGGAQPGSTAGMGAGPADTAFAPPSSTANQAWSPETAATLCYIPFVGWLASVWILVTDQFRRDRTVRFHAFQGLYLFVVWLIVDWFLEPILPRWRGGWNGYGSLGALPALLKLTILVGWVYMLVQTNKRRLIRLPLVGEWADRSLAEQA